MKLFPDQTQTVAAVLKSLNECGKTVLRAPTGAGKTVMAAAVAERANAKTLFFAHRREILAQAVPTLRAFGLKPARYKAFIRSPRRHNVAVVTADEALKLDVDFDLVCADECHHIVTPTQTRVYEKHKNSLILGMSATPQRTDKKPLSVCFDDMVSAPSVKELVTMNRLAPSHVKVPSFLLDNSQPDKTIGSICDTIQDHCVGHTVLVFCSSIKMSQNTVLKLKEMGISAAHLDGETPEARRDHTLKAWRDKKIQVICNVEIFSEGMDAPACDVVILARPTESLIMHLQQCGRAMRYAPNKTAKIYDLVGNCLRLGLPDTDYIWRLDTGLIPRDEYAALKVCSHCLTAYPRHKTRCPNCNYEGEKTEREDLYTQEKAEFVDIAPTIKPNYTRYLKAVAREARNDELRRAILAAGYDPKYLHVLRKFTPEPKE